MIALAMPGLAVVISLIVVVPFPISNSPRFTVSPAITAHSGQNSVSLPVNRHIIIHSDDIFIDDGFSVDLSFLQKVSDLPDTGANAKAD